MLQVFDITVFALLELVVRETKDALVQESACFHKTIKMPFIPQVGTKLILAGIDRAGATVDFEIQVEKICWHESSQPEKIEVHGKISGHDIKYLGGIEGCGAKLRSAGWQEKK